MNFLILTCEPPGILSAETNIIVKIRDAQLKCVQSNLLEFELCSEAAGCVFDGSPDECSSKPAVTEVRGVSGRPFVVLRDAY